MAISDAPPKLIRDAETTSKYLTRLARCEERHESSRSECPPEAGHHAPLTAKTVRSILHLGSNRET